MKFIADKNELVSALTIVSRVIGKSVIPIVEMVKLSIDNDRLTLTGSNMEAFISHGMDIKGGNFKRDIALQGANLINLLKALPDVPVNFHLEESKTHNEVAYKLLIEAGRGKYDIPVMNAEVYPSLKESEEKQAFTLDSEILLNGISKTAFACSDDELKPALTGVYTVISKGNISYVATNGHLLCISTTPAPLELDTELIIPKRTMSLLASLPVDESIQISIQQENITFVVNDDTVVKSRLIDAKYIAYQQVVPQDNDYVLRANKSELMASLKRVNQFTNKANNLVVLQADQNQLTLHSSDDIKGKSTEIIPCDYTHNAIRIGFSSDYLIDIISRIESEEIKVLLKDPKRPGLFMSSDIADGDYRNMMLIAPYYIEE